MDQLLFVSSKKKALETANFAALNENLTDFAARRKS
jgi:hypothetical protein